jgi:DNA topoisomerase-1
MDSYLVDEKRKLHICGNNPDCAGVRIEEGSFKIKGYDGPVIECDKCGAPMQLRSGRFGKYFACTKYPDCKNARKLLRNGQAAPPKAPPVHMPELKCAQSDGYFILRDGAAGVFLAASTYPRSRETRSPKVVEMANHRAELDPKFLYLADAPQQDDQKNLTQVRFSRKSREHYLISEKDGASTGWSAHWVEGKWQVRRNERPETGKHDKRKTTKRLKNPAKV